MTKMPEPVAYLHPSGGVIQRPITGLEKETFTVPLITTAQAEAYAQAVRREALEEAAKVCDDRAARNEAAISEDEPDEASNLRASVWQMSVCANAIRRLIDKESA